jgi:ribonuclease HI
VADGKTPGIYQTWDECLRQTSGVSGAKYKKFDDLTSAQNFISESRPSSKRGPDHSSYSTSSSKKSSQSYYAVNYENGQSDLFTNWNDCKRAVDGKKGVTYKKFDSFASAEKFTQSHGHDNSSQSEKQDAMDCYLRSYSNQHLESQRKAPVSHIFMDGSYMPIGRGKCGYGVYFGPNDPRNLAEPVNGVHVTDSFVGEVHATRAALNTIKNDIKSFESGQQSIIPKYVLSTDSETVIGILTKYAPTWSEKEFEQRSAGSELKEAYVMYKEVQDFYNRHSEVMDNHKFEIKWVKGHSGIDGNEAADQLAKAGAMKS